jgi:hypothetical protein
VVALLAIDFYLRFRESNEGFRFVLKHCYEHPSMIRLFIFGVTDLFKVRSGARTGRRNSRTEAIKKKIMNMVDFSYSTLRKKLVFMNFIKQN